MRSTTQLSVAVAAAFAMAGAYAQDQSRDRAEDSRAAAQTQSAQSARHSDGRAESSTSNSSSASGANAGADANPYASSSKSNSELNQHAAQTDGVVGGDDPAGSGNAQSGDRNQQQGSSTGSTRTAAATQSAQSGSAEVIPVVTVLVPVAMEKQANSSLANGCWAKLYGDAGFKGDTLTLVGPVDMSNMRGPFGNDWGDKVSSIKAGPNATVTIYDNEEYRDKAATVQSNEQIQEISSKMGFFEDVNSIRIKCKQPGAASG